MGFQQDVDTLLDLIESSVQMSLITGRAGPLAALSWTLSYFLLFMTWMEILIT